MNQPSRYLSASGAVKWVELLLDDPEMSEAVAYVADRYFVGMPDKDVAILLLQIQKRPAEIRPFLDAVVPRWDEMRALIEASWRPSESAA